MHEIELKLQVPAAQRAAVDAAVAGRAPAPRTRLKAAYHDTPERVLAGAGLALRLRREGRRCVQTLKGAADDGMTRMEHNVPRGSAAPMPPVAPELHAGTEVGDRLIALLAKQPAAALQTLYRTDIRRRTRTLPVRMPGAPAARVELAFDTGRIETDGRAIEVCELEIELLAGSPLAVIDTARRWLPRFGLWLDGRSKAERGDLLARGEAMPLARLATPARLEPQVSTAEAWQCVLRNSAEQILANANQVASGEYMPEHVHQLRVGLRRLRSAVKLFENDVDTLLGDGAAALFRQLGAARDQVVIDGEFGAPLAAAMRRAGVCAAPPSGTREAPRELAGVLRETASQTLLLDLLAAMHAEPTLAADDDPPLRARLAARLNRWHAQVVAGAKRYAVLDDADRPRLAQAREAPALRRRVLRRVVQAARRAALPEGAARLQERLGAVSDAAMAMAAFAQRGDTDAHAMFALGWLTARHEALIDAAVPELKDFAKVERFWKKKPD